MSDCAAPTLVGNGAGAQVSNILGQASNIATIAVGNATSLASALEQYDLQPMSLPNISAYFSGVEYTGFDMPGLPSYTSTSINTGGAPSTPLLRDPDLEAFDAIQRPTIAVPDAPDIAMPASPQLVTPVHPGGAPAFEAVEIPEYQGGPMPEVPELLSLDLPEPPEIDFSEFDIERPDFHDPSEHVFDNNYIADAKDLSKHLRESYADWDPDSVLVRERWQEMVAGGTGLPPEVEQMIFDRAVMREEASSDQAVKQAQGEWAARGFSLPGSTLLARESEIRRQNRVERGRINREITIQFHTQEVENLRFAVQQGAALEGQRFEQFIRTTEAARGIVDGYYQVAQTLFRVHVELLQAQIAVYQADIQAFREKVQIELARLEIFRSQLEAERIKGELNQQLVQIYEAQLRGVLANVEVFRAEVQGANAQIEAQLGQMRLYQSRIDAYRTEWEGERTKFDVYATRVNAEQAKTQLYQAQIQAFSERMRAYGVEVDAEATKVNAVNSVNESETRLFSALTDQWTKGIDAQIQELQARVNEFNGEVNMFSAQANAERSRVEGEARNAQITFEAARAELSAELKQADQQIELMRLQSTLGLEALKGAATVHGQLAGSALSAMNVSAQIADQVSHQRSMSSSCRTNYNYSGQI